MNRCIFSLATLILTLANVVAQDNALSTLLEQKRYAEIVSLKDKSDDIFLLNAKGQAYEGLMQYKSAYDYFKKAFAIDTTDIGLLYSLARTSVNLGYAGEAETYYKKILQQDKDSFYANTQLARLYGQTGKNLNALNIYQSLAEKYPENPTLLKLIGDCYVRADSMAEASTLYSSAFKLNKGNAQVASLAVNTILALNNPYMNNEAATLCDTALKYNPADKQLRQNRAMIYFVQKEYVRSDSIYTELMAEKDSSYITLKYCGCARYHAEKWFDAIEPLEKAFAKDTTAYNLCIYLGIALTKTYDPKLGLSYLNKAERLMQPDTTWVNLLAPNIANATMRTGNFLEGTRLYYELWKKNPKKYHRSINEGSISSHYKNDTPPDDIRQRIRFLSIFAGTETIKYSTDIKKEKHVFGWRLKMLKEIEEEMFMSGKKSLPMIAPDGKKSTLTESQLKELINRYEKLGVEPVEQRFIISQ